MLGRNPGYVTSQGEILTDHFRAAGYEVVSVSTSRNRYRRLLDIIATLLTSRQQVEIVVVEVYGGRSFVVEDIASVLGRLCGRSVVLHLHGGAMPQFMARFPGWTRRVFARADVIVAPSDFLATAACSYGNTPHIIPNLIDLAAYPFRRRERVRPNLFWMRSFHPLYNPLMALRVFQRVRATIPDATLTMAGQDTGYERTVRQEAARLGMQGAVRFVGFLDRGGKGREGEAADIFINTNCIDNAPVAVIEACAMGLPVVSTAVGGVPRLLQHGVSGLLVPDNDIDGMTKAVLDLIDDPTLAARLSTNGRALAEFCSWKHVGPQWEQLFARLRPEENHIPSEGAKD
jgi:glycosyltransferase involved in cell wall biosynthesis